MTEIIKKSAFYIKMLLIVGLLSQIDMSFALDVKVWSDPADLKSWDWNFVTTIELTIAWLIWFLYLVAIIFGLYAWFTILTAAWDEEKVKKWKTTMINVFIWLVVIFFSSVLINWVIDVFATWTPANI